MPNPYYNSVSTAKRFGGVAEDFLELQEWFDRGKASQPDFKHRCQSPCPTCGRTACTEYLGFIPTLQDWMELLTAKRWTSHRAKLLYMKAFVDTQSCE